MCRRFNKFSLTYIQTDKHVWTWLEQQQLYLFMIESTFTWFFGLSLVDWWLLLFSPNDNKSIRKSLAVFSVSCHHSLLSLLTWLCGFWPECLELKNNWEVHWIQPAKYMFYSVHTQSFKITVFNIHYKGKINQHFAVYCMWKVFWV